MTPQEELFASFFNDERAQIKDMGVLEMRAHREELAKIAFEARARLTAVDDEERTRRSKKEKDSSGKPTGFSTSLQTDELTSDAINKIGERKKKMSKQDKTLEGLIKLGMDRKGAEKLMSAGTILAKVRENEKKAGSETPESVTNFSNPFKPQTEELAQLIEVAIIEENTIVVTKTTEEKVEKPNNPSFNPFGNK